MRLLILLTLFNLVSCGKIEDLIHKKGKPPQRHTTDPHFKYYTDQLQMTVNTPIIFGVLDSKIAGTCTKWSSGYREIKINREYWNKISESHRLELLAHELGHCDYNKPHNNTTQDGCPVSVMYDTNFGDPCFSNNYNHYMNEFL